MLVKCIDDKRRELEKDKVYEVINDNGNSYSVKKLGSMWPIDNGPFEKDQFITLGSDAENMRKVLLSVENSKAAFKPVHTDAPLLIGTPLYQSILKIEQQLNFLIEGLKKEIARGER